MVKAEEIQNPRRILAVALEAETEQLARVVKDLTGTHPESAQLSLAGTTHDLDIKTPYYSATVPIWLDLITTPTEWAGTFLSDEAKEVLEVLGGVVAVFAIPPSTSQSSTQDDSVKALIKEVGRVVKEGLGGWEWDGVSLAVGVGEVSHLDDLDVWDEICGDAGLEFVHVASSASEDARNEFGEKVGIPRVLEALQSSDWASVPAAGGDIDEFLASDDADGPEGVGDDPLDPENLDFGFDREDFEGLKKAIWEARMEREEQDDGGQSKDEKSADAGKTVTGKEDDELDEGDVQQIEQMMRKLQAVRDMSAGLPEDQRKRMAARAVGEVMRDL